MEAVTTVTAPEALDVIRQEADTVGSRLQVIRDGTAFDEVETGRNGTSFRDLASGKKFQVPLSGKFQASNAALAIAVCRALGDPRVTDDTIARGLSAARFPGRMEVVQESPLVLLDGAHNPEKIANLAKNLKQVIGERRTIVVFGVLESKNVTDMWVELAPLADALIATAPRVQAKPPVQAADIARLAGAGIPVETEDDPLTAIERALEMATPGDAVLVTGSLYLVGNIREYWYPTDKILEQGTSWPS
jgi:dihydrofolate synthase/folylpolyglutamate synthase